MADLAIVILAAGKGTRLKQERPKVLTQTRSKALLFHVLDSVSLLSPTKTVLVTGYKSEEVEVAAREYVKNAKLGLGEVEFVLQEEQRGTGDAVRAALPKLSGFCGEVLLLYGDVPLVKPETLHSLINAHKTNSATISFITMECQLSDSYGRVKRDAQTGEVLEIIEARDCSPIDLMIREANSGLYLVDSAFLKPAIEALEPKNAQNEYYLTDIVAKAIQEGQRVYGHFHRDTEELQGVNTFKDLRGINSTLNDRKVSALSEEGVTFLDSDTCFIDEEVFVGEGTIIGSNVSLLGMTKIGSEVVIEGSAYINSSEIGDRTIIKFCTKMDSAVVGEDAAIGPFAHVRPKSVFGNQVKVGNFVETKSAILKDGAKASHLTYLGDAEVGEDVNIGAGTITCNYDGYAKHKTIIEKEASIGSNTSLVAPVTVEQGAYVGAGSVITKTVPKGSLAFTRTPMVVKEGWSKRRKK